MCRVMQHACFVVILHLTASLHENSARASIKITNTSNITVRSQRNAVAVNPHSLHRRKIMSSHWCKSCSSPARLLQDGLTHTYCFLGVGWCSYVLLFPWLSCEAFEPSSTSLCHSFSSVAFRDHNSDQTWSHQSCMQIYWNLTPATQRQFGNPYDSIGFIIATGVDCQKAEFLKLQEVYLQGGDEAIGTGGPRHFLKLLCCSTCHSIVHVQVRIVGKPEAPHRTLRLPCLDRTGRGFQKVSTSFGLWKNFKIMRVMSHKTTDCQTRKQPKARGRMGLVRCLQHQLLHLYRGDERK